MVERDIEQTLTIFRKYKGKDGGDIVALFPEVEHNWPYCVSYHHVGQHGSADYGYVVTITKPTTPDEYADLKEELESIGYNLKIRRKWIRGKRRGAG